LIIVIFHLFENNNIHVKTSSSKKENRSEIIIYILFIDVISIFLTLLMLSASYRFEYQQRITFLKYFIYNFHLSFENNLLIQYDPNIYETYYPGKTENWLINKKELLDAYNKMFCYIDECQGCYYKDKCYGIQREYLKFYPKKEVNNEIKLLKLMNWK